MTSLDTDIALVRRQTLGDLLHRSAARHPDRVAITDGRVTRTYEDLDGDANRLAHALIERGVAAGDRVAGRSRIGDGHILDLAPTVFSLLDLDVPGVMPGHSLL